MARLPRNPATKDEMTEIQEKKSSSKIYKEISSEHRKAELSALAGRLGREVKKPETLCLTTCSIDDLQDQVQVLFDACEETGTLPSVIGLARCLGYSRSGLYAFLDTQAHTENAKYLEIVRDAISDGLDSACLANAVNYAYGIFVQKSVHLRVDRSELFIETPQYDDPAGPVLSHDEIVQKYLPDEGTD